MAIVFALMRQVGWFDTAMIVASLGILWLGKVVWHKHRWYSVGLFAIGLVGLELGVWDRACFVDDCRDCGYQSHVICVRVLGIPVSEDRFGKESLKGLLAQDLGVPCAHPHASPLLLHRAAGGVWMEVYVMGVHRLDHGGSPEWYTGQVRELVRARRESSPAECREFHQRVFVEEDSDYYRNYVEELKEVAGVDPEAGY